MFTFDPPVSRGETAARGLLAAVLGGVLVAWPGITIATVVALFATFAFADAVMAVVRAFDPGRATGDRILLFLRAAIEVTAGVVAIAYPGATAGAMTVILGLFAIATGVNELVGSRRLARLGIGGTGWLTVGGLLSALAGLALVVWPGIGTVTLAIVFGLYLAGYGVVLLISAAVQPSPTLASSEASR